MASVSRSQTSKGEVRWRVRWRDDTGRQREQWFRLAADARRRASEIEHTKAAGTYVAPEGGRTTFEAWASVWLDAQTFGPTTRERTERAIRLHLLPLLGSRALGDITPTTLGAWQRDRSAELAPSTLHVTYGLLRSILGGAVDEGLIARSPASAPTQRRRAPKPVRARLNVWSHDQVTAVLAELPADQRAIAVLAAGAGLRQGECFGLALGAIGADTLDVRQQVRTEDGRRVLAPPKHGTGRTVPLAPAVRAALDAHLATTSPGRDGLLFLTGTGTLRRSVDWNKAVWWPALERAGIEHSRENGLHALRHYFASVLLHEGVSVVALARYLGHSDPAFTLRVYGHLVEGSDERARAAIDRALAHALG